jgi:hypothetical protein
MGYEISFAKLSDDRKVRDRLAVMEVLRYVGRTKFKFLVQIAQHEGPTVLNFGMAIAGVQGFPYHAMCRRYCLKSYREWMHSGNDPVMTDEHGFSIG